MTCSLPAGRVANPDGRGNGLRLLHDVVEKNRRGTGRLESGHARQLRGPAELVEFAVALPVSRDVAGVADRQNVDIRRVAQFLDDFEGRRFLSFDPERIDRVDDLETPVGAEFTHQPQGIIKVAADGDDFGPVNKSLEQFAGGDFSGGQQHGAGQVGTCGVSGGGGRGVAGRSANDRLGSALDGFGNGHRHPAIFERSRRVESFVFDVDLRAAPDEPAQLRRINQRGGSLVERDHGGGVGDWEVLPVAADHPSIVPVCHEAASTR